MLLYCIRHGKMVKAERPKVCPLGHMTQEVSTEEDTSYGILRVTEIDYCCFEDGFAFCPPPDESVDPYLLASYEWTQWIDSARPSDDDILISDLNALSLRLELEGA